MSAPSDTPSTKALHSQLWVCDLETVPYKEAVEIQLRLQALRQQDLIADTLLLLQHLPVYTRGRRAQDAELSLGEDFYKQQGIDVLTTNRGGRVTYHGPGQLVGYPIMRVQDVIGHLRSIEQAIVAALALVGIQARSRVDDGPDWTGVWVGERKIASLGVHVSKGVSTHGFAINVINDLTPFSWIVPCGLSGVSMTSVAQERASQGDRGAEMIDFFERFALLVAQRFAEARARRIVQVSPPELGIGVAPAAPAEPSAAAHTAAASGVPVAPTPSTERQVA